nr:hypothetical protein CFP56_20046 [Quercus suber]
MKQEDEPPKFGENQTHAVLVSIYASEYPRLGFTFLRSHLHCQHSKTQQPLELCSRRPITPRSKCRTQCTTILTMAFGSEIATVFVA